MGINVSSKSSMGKALAAGWTIKEKEGSTDRHNERNENLHARISMHYSVYMKHQLEPTRCYAFLTLQYYPRYTEGVLARIILPQGQLERREMDFYPSAGCMHDTKELRNMKGMSTIGCIYYGGVFRLFQSRLVETRQCDMCPLL